MPSSRTPASPAASPATSSAPRPCRCIDVTASTTTRAPPPARSVSRCATVCSTLPVASAAATGYDGVSTSTSPGNAAATSGSSSAVPTATVSTPSSAASAASRALPTPYPLPLTTGTIPGVASTVARRCRRQRSSSTYSENVTFRPRRTASWSAPAHVDVEGLEQHLVERQVPLPDVLHRLAAGAELELDEPDVRV